MAMPNTAVQRVVFDTNSLLSAAIIKYSISARAFQRGFQQFELVMCDAAYAELTDVIYRKKFDRYFVLGSKELFLEKISRLSTWVRITVAVTDCRDPKDNQFLELALSAGAKVIVTGDDDLLTMHPYQGVRIVNASTFLEM